MGISVPKLEIKYLLQTDFFFSLYQQIPSKRVIYIVLFAIIRFFFFQNFFEGL